MNIDLKGIIPPVITPFDENGRFSAPAMKEILDFLIGQGVHAVFVVGSVSEFYALRMDEIKEIIRSTVEIVDGRVPVLAGTGAISTRDTVELCQYAEEAGADALSVITPFYIKLDEDELYAHYAAVAGSVRIPVLGYTNPGRAGGMTLSPGLMSRLANDFENVLGIKDSSGDMTTLVNYKRLCPPEFLVFTGQDTLVFDAVANRAAGAVAGISNFAPALLVSVYELAAAGRWDEARTQQQKVIPLREAYALGSFPSVTKEAAAMIGLPAGPCRLPIQPLRPEARQRLRKLLIETLGADVVKG
jgi:4-hydroxy-tetrahydrodipicolinate synthase